MHRLLLVFMLTTCHDRHEIKLTVDRMDTSIASRSNQPDTFRVFTASLPHWNHCLANLDKLIESRIEINQLTITVCVWSWKSNLGAFDRTGVQWGEKLVCKRCCIPDSNKKDDKENHLEDGFKPHCSRTCMRLRCMTSLCRLAQITSTRLQLLLQPTC